MICAFGREWYEELETVAAEMKRQHYLEGME